MANLKEKDKIALGQFIIESSQNTATRQKLATVEGATELLTPLFFTPNNHTFEVHLDEADRTHIILPLGADIVAVIQEVQNGGKAYPDEYVDKPLKAELSLMDQLRFRIGEYTMGRCKT